MEMTFMNDPNPSRKCGSKKHDAFYAEGGDFSEDGALNTWTWLLGDGLENSIFLKVPARQVVAIDPVLTVFFKSFMYPTNADVVIPGELEERYERLNLAMKSPGVADHVGANNYTAHNFYVETSLYGPSRRIPQKTAKYLAEIISLMGPIPMLFTHSKIPVFRDKIEMISALQVIQDDFMEISQSAYWLPSWEYEQWGMYARRGQWPGHDHVLIPILAFIDKLEDGLIEDDKAKDFFKSLTYTEQTLGLSWLTKITYTLPEAGELGEDILGIPGLNIIDLDAYQEINAILEGANERT